jgi:hypothetical protein
MEDRQVGRWADRQVVKDRLDDRVDRPAEEEEVARRGRADKVLAADREADRGLEAEVLSVPPQ